MKRLVLASRSPRRREILKQLGLDFEIMESNIEEAYSGGDKPHRYASFAALQKAKDVAQRVDFPAVIMGADTIVVLEGEVMGKPKDDLEAFEMLSRLSGKQHRVITGLAVVDATNGKELNDYQTTLVNMKNITTARIKRYVDTGEPLDKAGAYAIQGRAAVFVDSIKGCYFNVVGLPVAKLDGMLQAMGLELF